MSPDEARERIRLDLMNQARMKNYREAVLKLKEQARVQIVLEEPRVPFNPTTNAPSRGSKTGLVTITEYSDFQCPFCRGSQEVTKRILKDFGEQVRLVFKNLPLDIHTEAFGAARAAFCASEQDSFWQYHDALFASDVMSAEVFNKIAINQKLNMPKFNACLASESSRVAVMKDMQEAKRLGIAGTPSYVVNGKLIRGAIGFEEFKTIIEQEILLARNTSRTTQP
jgi:protein-disulfide isomerase